MAARARIVYKGRKTLTGALLDLEDTHSTVTSLESASNEIRGPAKKSSLDTIEILIARLVDQGNTLPISQQESFEGTKWLAKGNIDALPSPVPRGFVLYLAKAFADEGKFPSMEAALQYILDNKL